jgi:hypothetical protein
MTKLRFSKSEVQAFVETLILDQIATEDEQIWYEEFIWTNKFNKNYTYRLVLKKMKNAYEGK